MSETHRQCWNCHAGNLSPVVLPIYRTELDHDGRKYPIEIQEFHVHRCDNCNTIVVDDDEEDRLSDALRDAAGLLHPDQIREYRKALNLTQAELAKSLSISPSTLSRWENGGQIQQRCMDKFLRVFFAFPEVQTALLSDNTAWQLTRRIPEETDLPSVTRTDSFSRALETLSHTISKKYLDGFRDFDLREVSWSRIALSSTVSSVGGVDTATGEKEHALQDTVAEVVAERTPSLKLVA
jgi:putative zinc finger/helix-turn-helix YgiT family protein